jgi:hypothetical protein
MKKMPSLRLGFTNHLKKYRRINPQRLLYKTPKKKSKTKAPEKAGSAFDQSRVSTKCPQDGKYLRLCQRVMKNHNPFFL